MGMVLLYNHISLIRSQDSDGSQVVRKLGYGRLLDPLFDLSV